jgi:hypothetical protein
LLWLVNVWRPFFFIVNTDQISLGSDT